MPQGESKRKLQCEQECRGAGSALSTFHKPISADDLGSSGLENRRGAWRESAYLRSITGPNEGYFIPGRMEMYFADKVMPNWQVMVTLGDLFPRFPLGVCGGGMGGNPLFSHQALTERSKDKQHPRDAAHSVWRASSTQRWFLHDHLHFQWGHFLTEPRSPAASVLESPVYAEWASVGINVKQTFLVIMTAMQKDWRTQEKTRIRLFSGFKCWPSDKKGTHSCFHHELMFTLKVEWEALVD